ncbi:MAG: AAA family ATPase [Myxococcaceae bacterium]|nr:AAA family ATPase [Myxococcaceae bacterium]
MAPTLTEASLAIRDALTDASRGLVEREQLVDLIALTAIAQEHLLVIGPPGTAKSEAVRRVARTFGGRYFEYLLGRFTEPSEVFGPVDLKKLKDGLVETQTAGMLPEAEIAFLDEVFLGSTAILNTLLGLLNERVFRRGHTLVKCPLRVCIGASNAIPEEPSLAAFADRFLVRVFVEPIADAKLEALLDGGAALARLELTQRASLEHLDVLSVAAKQANTARLRDPLAHAVRLLRKAGVELSDRRVVKVQRLACAAAVMGGRTEPTDADLWPIVYAVPTLDGQRLAQDVLKDVLKHSQSSALIAAAEAASNAPGVRAARIAETATGLFTQAPAADDGSATERWLLKLEGVAREIDASFDPTALPAELVPVRARLTELLRPR